jgi:hypothetical protein
MKFLSRILLAFLALAGAANLHGQAILTINFDDLAFGSHPDEQYAAALGIHFLGGDTGVQNGLTNGDSGNWGVDGTQGPFFLGFNGPTAPDVLQTDPYKEKITFDFTAVNVSLDVSRTSGSLATDTFTLNAYDASNTMVATQKVTLSTINVWQTLTVSAPEIKSVLLLGEGTGFHPYGIDKIQFTPVPEPSAVALLAAGLLGLGWRRRRS